jgi:hypothetical protein
MGVDGFTAMPPLSPTGKLATVQEWENRIEKTRRVFDPVLQLYLIY